jgi:hypothetical protein
MNLTDPMGWWPSPGRRESSLVVFLQRLSLLLLLPQMLQLLQLLAVSSE